VLVIVLCDSPYEKIGKWKTISILYKDISGASVAITATFLLVGVSGATVSKVMSAYTNHEKTTSVKRKSGRKSTLTKSDGHTLRRSIS
jgi:hypothetical protein